MKKLLFYFVVDQTRIMSHKHRREENSSPLSHSDKAKMAIRQAFNKPSNTSDNLKSNFHFNLYETDRQERINEIVDDADGDLIVEREFQSFNNERPSRTIEINDRRHDAVIFGDKETEGKSFDVR